MEATLEGLVQLYWIISLILLGLTVVFVTACKRWYVPQGMARVVCLDVAAYSFHIFASKGHSYLRSKMFYSTGKMHTYLAMGEYRAGPNVFVGSACLSGNS